jgi:phosphoserine phosphatase RsbU/P
MQRMKKKRILLFDEVEHFIRRERIFLLRDEFYLITARTGQEALRMTRDICPDLIFLDLYMSGLNGDECCRTLKKDERYRDIPVIMVSHSGSEHDLERCREAGCDAVVLKPISRLDFLEAVHRHLQVKKRNSSRFAVRIHIHYGTPPQQLLEDYAVNLSTGGVFLETEHLLAAGTPLTVQFLLPKGGRQIECQARVVWINNPELPRKPDLPPGVGLQFRDLSLESLDLIRDYIRAGSFVPVEASSAAKSVLTGWEVKALKILIADDNAASRQRLRAALEGEQYAILTVDTGREAWSVASLEHLDLVIVNTALKEDAGCDLCARLNGDPKTSNLPVLTLSGETLAIESICGVALGGGSRARQSLPISRSDILDSVRNCLSLHQMSESLFRTREQLLAHEQEMEESLHAAAVIQHSLLPLIMPKGTPFNFAWRFLPCDRVGGDLFNVFKLDETHLGAYVIDVCGHGVPAAMITTSVAQALDPLSGQLLKRITHSPPYYELASPAEVLTRLNLEYPIERFEKHFTICYFQLDTVDGTVRYSNAGHPFPLLVGAKGSVERLGKGGTIIGMGEGSVFEEEEIRMEAGDRLFLFTDGIVEFENAQGEFYGEERFVQELRAGCAQKLQTACARIICALRSFGSGASPGDDITLLGIEYRGPSKPGVPVRPTPPAG